MKRGFNQAISGTIYNFNFNSPDNRTCVATFEYNGKEKKILLRANKRGEWKIDEDNLPDEIAYMQVDFHEMLKKYLEENL
ncbi:hypothetical protein U0033_28190 [Chitinophaga sancti]|uniref:Uncharacterized protein n=1 Tax=Chitinophaga sancti TaxID=1004 RepID=A0ABZ0XQN8_9BACT|nr:hypothetical protein [Chitinophaga sancti]WQD61441.1 hypothetical protein U0033_26550 [Chitinophaga sancti]WQD61766.1 hypothetical protein U0033_28190 [Chitinophaga sancti]WQG92668.1 hypothetical protein SR876_14210 [Chitinophaga sancti]WQG93006.1 hypothetical protein SR876_15910 [Chitinophaga sancti]